MSDAVPGRNAPDTPEFARRTEKALASLERAKLKRERSGAVLGMAAGGFGNSVSGGVMRTLVKYIPIAAAAGLTVLAVYSLVLSVA